LSWAAGGNLLITNDFRLVKLGVGGKSQTQLLGDPSALMGQLSSPPRMLSASYFSGPSATVIPSLLPSGDTFSQSAILGKSW